jgi:hypothetical protein
MICSGPGKTPEANHATNVLREAFLDEQAGELTSVDQPRWRLFCRLLLQAAALGHQRQKVFC